MMVIAACLQAKHGEDLLMVWPKCEQLQMNYAS